MNLLKKSAYAALSSTEQQIRSEAISKVADYICNLRDLLNSELSRFHALYGICVTTELYRDLAYHAGQKTKAQAKENIDKFLKQLSLQREITDWDIDQRSARLESLDIIANTFDMLKEGEIRDFFCVEKGQLEIINPENL